MGELSPLYIRSKKIYYTPFIYTMSILKFMQHKKFAELYLYLLIGSNAQNYLLKVVHILLYMKNHSMMLSLL